MLLCGGGEANTFQGHSLPSFASMGFLGPFKKKAGERDLVAKLPLLNH